MYARSIRHQGEKKTVTLAVSGMLWNQSLVMVDSQTKSLWSHLLGRAMAGPLEGTKLDRLPGLMTDWKTWRKRHPNTTVMMLERTSRVFQTEFYARPEGFVVGLTEGEQAKSWSLDVLLKHPVVNDELAGTPLLVTLDEPSKTLLIYERQLGERVLRFGEQDGVLLDEETGSAWDRTTGRAISGPLAGESLTLVPGILSFREVWKAFHPENQEYAP